MKANFKTALVTGANRGLGLETCRQLASLGHEVYLGARDLDKGLKAASALEDQGLKVFPVELDVTKSASIKSAVNSVQEKSGKLDILVNNAGVMLDTGEGKQQGHECRSCHRLENNGGESHRAAQSDPSFRKVNEGAQRPHHKRF